MFLLLEAIWLVQIHRMDGDILANACSVPKFLHAKRIRDLLHLTFFCS